MMIRYIRLGCFFMLLPLMCCREKVEQSWPQGRLLGLSVDQVVGRSGYSISKHIKVKIINRDDGIHEELLWNVQALHSNKRPWTDTLLFSFSDDVPSEINLQVLPFRADSLHPYFRKDRISPFDSLQGIFLKNTTSAFDLRIHNVKVLKFTNKVNDTNIYWNDQFGIVEFESSSWETSFVLSDLSPFVFPEEK